MRHISFLLLLFGSFSATGFAQNASTSDVSRITFLNPGFSYEKSMGPKTTLYGHAYFNPLIWFTYYTSSEGAGIHLDLDPTLHLQYRYYYNYKQRREKEKRTEENSMNYVSPFVATTYTQHLLNSDYPAQTERHAVYSLGLLWGLQRNYDKRFSLDLNLGLKYSFAKIHLQGTERPITIHENELNPAVNINLGFWLNRR